MDAEQVRVAIPREMLRDLYMVRKAKAALALGLCPDCSNVLAVIDTWERACPDKNCGYAFNYYDWPWVGAAMESGDGEAG